MQSGEEESHLMVLEGSKPTGEEEWYCPACGRRMLVTWMPRFKRVVVTPGNELATHSGGKSGLGPEGQLVMGSMQTDLSGSSDTDGDIEIPPYSDADLLSSIPAESSHEEDPFLVPWQLWMDKVGFDQLWDQGR